MWETEVTSSPPTSFACVRTFGVVVLKNVEKGKEMNPCLEPLAASLARRPPECVSTSKPFGSRVRSMSAANLPLTRPALVLPAWKRRAAGMAKNMERMEPLYDDGVAKQAVIKGLIHAPVRILRRHATK